MATFIRTKEDFQCENCDFFVEGNGYTNHCPECLWSRHVDVFPGDRKEKCKGMMKPAYVEKKGETMSLVHECVVCFKRQKNKLASRDNDTAVLNVMTYI